MSYEMDFSDATPPEITFKRELASSEYSVIFLVEVRNKSCVMKVVCLPYTYKQLFKDPYILITPSIAPQ